MAGPKETSPESQIPLLSSQEPPDTFRKAVQVVHSTPKSPLTLLQRKLGNAWLKHAIRTAPDREGWWELPLRQLSDTIGFDSNNRQYLRESAEALMRIVFEWDVIAPTNKRVQWKASVLFPEIEIRSDAVRYQISSQMRDRMINPEIYAMIDMRIVRRFRRAPSLAIWEFCVRFERIGKTASVPWEKFRDMVLGESSEGKTYQEYKYFKSKVLNTAISEINAVSDHVIGLEEEKSGRRIAALRFSVVRKQEPSDDDHADRRLELIGELAKLGVPQSESKKLAKAHSLDDITAALEYTKKRARDPKFAKLDNPSAYFRHALANRYAAMESKTVAEPARNREQPSFDLRGAFLAAQANEAERYFAELDEHDQAELVQRYNTQQPVPLLRVAKKAGKAAQAAFSHWLARETWGEPTPEALVDFAQQELTKRG